MSSDVAVPVAYDTGDGLICVPCGDHFLDVRTQDAMNGEFHPDEPTLEGMNGGDYPDGYTCANCGDVIAPC